MRYNPLGRTGLFVSELCLGAMTFGGNGGMWEKIGSLKQDAADQMVRTAFDAGINFFDTADVYAGGLSEQFTGQALRNLGVARDQYVLATKAFGAMGEGPNQRGNSRSHLIEACKASLKRLGVDHIDLYQIHGWDAATPIDETLAALDTLVQHGHVRHIGVSNWAAWQIAKALGLSAKERLARFETLQAYYTVAGRDLEREHVPMLLSEKMGLMVWSPLAGGFLSGKYGRDDAGKGDGRRADFDFPPVDKERGYDVIDAMRPIAEAHGASLARIAIAWLLHQPVVTSVIVGATKIAQLEDNIAAAGVALSAEDLAALDKVSMLPAEYPGWMIAMQGSYRVNQLAEARRGTIS